MDRDAAYGRPPAPGRHAPLGHHRLAQVKAPSREVAQPDAGDSES